MPHTGGYIIMKLLFILNPVAGPEDQEPVQPKISDYCRSNDFPYHITETKGDGNDLQRIREALDQQKPELVFACGGDGTVNMVGQTLMGQNIPLGVLPLGSANGLATELNLPYNVRDCMDVLIHGKTIAMDPLLINQSHYSFHLADVGYNARLIQQFEEMDQRGKIGYAKGFFKVIRDRPVANIRYQEDGTWKEKKVIMAVFANARKYGTGAIINPDGKLDDGQFEVILFRPWPRWYFVYLGLLSYLGRIKRSAYVKVLSQKKIHLSTDVPMDMQIDGEPMGSTRKVTVEICPEKVQLKVPDSF